MNVGRTSLRVRSAIWLLDDDLDTSQRQTISAKTGRVAPVTIRLHKLVDGAAVLAATWRYKPGSDIRANRAQIAEDLLSTACAKKGVVVAAQRFASRSLADLLQARGFDFIFEIRPSSSAVATKRPFSNSNRWVSFELPVPTEDGHRDRLAFARFGPVSLWDRELELVALAPGGLTTSSLVRFALSSRGRISARKVTTYLGWLRWLKLLDRQTSTAETDGALIRAAPPAIGQRLRPNIHRSSALDEQLLGALSQLEIPFANGHHPATKARPKRVVDLFSGAGLLGLGFVEAESSPFQIVFQGEVDPVYVETLVATQRYLAALPGARCGPVSPIESIDLRKTSSLEKVLSVGDIDVVIGGPPCQGFSNANRNSWSLSNPNNLLVDTFLRYVRELAPSAVVLENVQGILWTSKAGIAAQTSTARHMMTSLKRAGFHVYARLLDAVWYGVPQRRTRFFLIALRKDLGIEPGDLGEWGPFPMPTHGPGLKAYTTVRNAIADLPPIGNGHTVEVMSYAEPSASELESNDYLGQMRAGATERLITDHITSKQANYVLERYRRIPAGGNWESITRLLTNYRDVSRTHSNIYRRLSWDEPAVTIGHYRKAMIVHPAQHRGISLREASRLQSIPDWFRFSGSRNGRHGGLMHKQQQLANAVSPLVAKAIAERLAQLL